MQARSATPSIASNWCIKRSVLRRRKAVADTHEAARIASLIQSSSKEADRELAIFLGQRGKKTSWRGFCTGTMRPYDSGRSPRRNMFIHARNTQRSLSGLRGTLTTTSALTRLTGY